MCNLSALPCHTGFGWTKSQMKQAMTNDPVKEVPLQLILEALGSQRQRGDMYISPLRPENKPSLHVSPVRNVWYDHGGPCPCGGNNIKLVMLARDCTYAEARRFILSLDPDARHLEEVRSYNRAAPRESQISIVSSGSIFSRSIKAYLKRRNIPLIVASAFCRELTIKNRRSGNVYPALGFRNTAPDGWVINTSTGRKLSTACEITVFDTSGERTLQPSCPRVALFEGLFDFLSFATINLLREGTVGGRVVLPCDCVVLNSVVNYPKAVGYAGLHEVLLDYLDSDEAGRRTAATLAVDLPGCEMRDMTGSFRGHKDLNEAHCEGEEYKPFRLGGWKDFYAQ